MNRLDKILAKVFPFPCENNPYELKELWGWHDYLIGYGCPLAILILTAILIEYLRENLRLQAWDESQRV